MALRPGSLPWLMAHEMRLGWREFRGKRAVFVGIFALLFAFVALMIVPARFVRAWSSLRREGRCPIGPSGCRWKW